MKTNEFERVRSEATSIGFCSEHTAEYVLVPHLRSVLEAVYPVAIALFVWFTREGARGCSSIDRDKPVKLVAVFPRRPKVHSMGQETIVVKFNEELFEYAAIAASHGIATLAGAPLASSLFDLTSRCRVAWFAVEAENVSEDQSVRLSLVGENPRAAALGVAGPLNESELLAVVNRKAQTMRWASGIAALRDIRNRVKRARYPWWAGGYKPFVMLIPDDEPNCMETNETL